LLQFGSIITLNIFKNKQGRCIPNIFENTLLKMLSTNPYI
jgi:hypothetical protein